MSIYITSHAYIRYIERSMDINLDDFKDWGMEDKDILDFLNIDTNILNAKILGNQDRLKKIITTIGGDGIVCKIGVGRTHRLVVLGNKILSVLPND